MSGDCWLYLSGKDICGYGVFWYRGKSIKAHRFAWGLANIPKGIQVLHKCDIPNCVNPSHLFLGTQKDNMVDKTKKNRQSKGYNHVWNLYPEKRLKGERNPAAKLTLNQVEQIKSSVLSITELSQYFEISKTTISDIRRGRTWNG